MAARTNIETLSGATLAISATLPATYDQAGYESTDNVFTLIGQIENFGNHGVTANIVEFTPVATAVVTKLKGRRNYGTMNLMIGSIPSDAGQTILEAASESNNHYSAKMLYPDGEIHYLDVLVASKEYQDGSVDDPMKIACSFAVCRKPVVIAAS